MSVNETRKLSNHRKLSALITRYKEGTIFLWVVYITYIYIFPIVKYLLNRAIKYILYESASFSFVTLKLLIICHARNDKERENQDDRPRLLSGLSWTRKS